jgi:Cu+-exporting ATPase
LEGEHHFCCAGCQTVYALLHQSGLSTYYSLEDSPGLKPASAIEDDEYAYLDKSSIRDRLLDFDDSDIARMTFSIPQIHCSSCIWLLENLFKINPGVRSSRVNFQRRQVSVVFDSQRLPVSRLVAILASLGYEPEIRLSDLDPDRPEKSSRALYARVAVAGLCFGNVMLLSFPHYLGMEAVGEFLGGRLFDYLKILLSLPVVLYCATDFYRSAAQGLRHRQINMDVPIALGIVVLTLRSSYGILVEGTAGYLDSLCALVFLLLLGRLFQKKTYFSIAFDRDYRAYLPVAVRCLSKTGESSLPLEEINVGDRLVIRAREIIPADGVLIKGDALIDYSFVTGESEPVRVVSGDRIFAGGRQTGGRLEIEITSQPSRSYLFRLWEEMESTTVERSNVSTLANQVSRYFTPAVLGLAALTGLYWWWVNPALIWSATTAVLIIACPCALALSSPFALGAAQRFLGKAGIFLKDSAVVERLASLTTLVFDKTGTITRSTSGEPEWIGESLTDEQESYLSALVRQSMHPLSVALRRHLGDRPDVVIDGFREELGRGLEAQIDDRLVRLGSATWTGSTPVNDSTATLVYVSIDGKTIGYYRIASQYRPGLERLLGRLAERYRLLLLSGDHEGERPTLTRFLGQNSELHFNQSPHDKLHRVTELARDGAAVGMIGDGLNDAGALKAARVGLTIVEGTSSFSPASDGVIDSRSFELLPSMLRFSRDTVRIIKASFALSFVYNVVGLGFAVQGDLSPLVAAVLMPVSSVSVVLFATLTTGYFAKVRGLTRKWM